MQGHEPCTPALRVGGAVTNEVERVYDRVAVSRECRLARARKDARVRVVRIDPLTGDGATSRRGRATSSGAISTSTSQHTGPSSTPGSAYLLIEQSGAIPDSQRVVRCTPRSGPPAQSRDALSRRADTEAIYERGSDAVGCVDAFHAERAP